MDKVKLPREVAIAIDVLGAKWGRKAFLQADFIRKSSHPEATIINEHFKPFHDDGQDGFDKLFFALYNGYEVEETPRDKVKSFYETASTNKSILLQHSAISYDEVELQNGIMRGIEGTLNRLNIKIEGVN